VLLGTCEAPITEEEFCMLVSKYDINEDGFISDTELLAHVRRSRCACACCVCALCTTVCVCVCVMQLEHLCGKPSTHITSRMWNQPTRSRYQSPYPPEMPMFVPRPSSPAIADSLLSTSRQDVGTPEVVRTIVLSGSAQGKSRHRSPHRRGVSGAEENGGEETRRLVYATPDQMRKALKGWGMTLDEEQVVAFLRRFDVHDDGNIDFSTFGVMVAEMLCPGEAAFLSPSSYEVAVPNFDVLS
jgi:hypothetical protein